jgi:hypothetical protein
MLRFVLPAMTFLTGFSLVSVLAEDAGLPPRRIAHAVVATGLLADLAGEIGAPSGICSEIREAKTARHAAERMKGLGLPGALHH